MKQSRLLLVLLLSAFIVVGLSTGQDQQYPTAPAGDPQSPSAMAIPQIQPSLVRILTPTAGQTLSATYVHLRFELARPAPSGEPIFLVQLDSNDPISTTDTDYTFPDVQPGPHTIRVTLVDANNSPIGATATVQFKVPAQQPAPGNASRGVYPYANRNIAGAPPAPPIPPELHNSGDINLPLKGSPLPLISVIGFGLLIGVVARAMRPPGNPLRRVQM